MKGLNLGVRFLLELCALAALGYWGAQLGRGPILSVALAVLLPLVAAVAWGTFVAPKRKVDVPRLRFIVELAVMASAAVGLLVTEHVVLGVSLLAVYAANRAMLAAWRQDTGLSV